MMGDKIKGCLYAGAIGDCIGSAFENSTAFNASMLNAPWQISDDTQLTLATCESIIENKKTIPGKVAAKFLEWFNKGKVTGMGSSTLQAMQALQVGGHWALAGRQGEYAAGNGAAMRIAPLAFVDADRQLIRDICRITHRNDEAYTGALAIVEGIKAAVKGTWNGTNELIPLLVELLPDTRVRDRLIELSNEKESISAISKKYGNNGYVVNSVPLAIYAAAQISTLSIEEMFLEIIKGGGDTDTICSMAGNLAGALLGSYKLPALLLSKLGQLKETTLITSTVTAFGKMCTQY